MKIIEKHTPHTFSWAELVGMDAEVAKKFYTQLFGWSIKEFPMGEGMGNYIMFQVEDKNAAACYEMSPDQKKHAQGHSFWMNYITVENVDEMTEKAKSMGANIMMGPMDVFDSGRMTAMMDPNGALVSMWQPKEHIGAQITQVEGTVAWVELCTNNPDKADEFYTGVFGWATKKQDMGGFIYTEYKLGELSVAGMMKVQPEWGEVPDNWGVYFTVNNCDEALKKALSLGAKEVMPAMDIPNVGRFVLITDPQGAYLYLFEWANMDEDCPNG